MTCQSSLLVLMARYFNNIPLTRQLDHQGPNQQECRTPNGLHVHVHVPGPVLSSKERCLSCDKKRELMTAFAREMRGAIRPLPRDMSRRGRGREIHLAHTSLCAALSRGAAPRAPEAQYQSSPVGRNTESHTISLSLTDTDTTTLRTQNTDTT